MLETAALLLALSVGTNAAPAVPTESPNPIVETVTQITEGLVPYQPPEPEPELPKPEPPKPEPPKPEPPKPEPPKPEQTKPETPKPQTPPGKPWVNPYGQTLGTATTSFARSNRNRSTNIELATKACNGYILKPGETFSFNTVVGKRTKERGYKEAGVYVNGQTDTGIGGGICQVSSTLFNAALESNMTITARRAHSLPVSYLPKGRDAAVSWGGPEFKFKNPYKFPVMIGTYYDKNGKLTMSILGPSDAKVSKPVIKVTQKNGVYTLTRSVDGKVNYTANSTYGKH